MRTRITPNTDTFNAVWISSMLVLIGLHILKMCFSWVFNFFHEFYSCIINTYLYLWLMFSIFKICLKLLRHQFQFSFKFSIWSKRLYKIYFTSYNVTCSNTFHPYSNISIILGFPMFISTYIFQFKFILKLFRNLFKITSDSTC